MDSWDDQQVATNHETIDPITFVASNNPDVMYYDQVMKQPDAAKFSKACDNEIAAHHENGDTGKWSTEQSYRKEPRLCPLFGQ